MIYTIMENEGQVKFNILVQEGSIEFDLAILFTTTSGSAGKK